MATEAASSTRSGEIWMRIGETATRPTSSPSANPREKILSARDSGMPCAIRWRASQFHTPTSQDT